MSRDTEFVKKVILNMKYDSTKTLSENKTLLNEASTISWVADRDYDLETTGPNYTLYKGATFKSFPDNTWVPKHYGSNYDSYYSKCPGPDCIAKSTAYSYMGYVRNLLFTCKPDTCEIYDVTSMAIFDSCLVNSTLASKLRAKFCTSAKEIQLTGDYIEVTPEMMQMYKVQADAESGKLKTSKATTPPKQEQPKKTQEEINKELLAKDNAYEVVPRLYAASLGYKDWKTYQKQFCCPTYAENPTENAKCNENIGLAMSKGWKPGDGIPEGMSYCEGDEKFFGDEVIIDDGTGKSAKGEGESTPIGATNGEESLIWTEPKPYFQDMKPEEDIWGAKFDGDIYTWMYENFVYPKSAIKNKQEGTVEISFIVKENGQLENFNISGSSGIKVLDDYALELLKTMPNWKPATKKDIPIETKVILPVEFSLD